MSRIFRLAVVFSSQSFWLSVRQRRVIFSCLRDNVDILNFMRTGKQQQQQTNEFNRFTSSSHIIRWIRHVPLSMIKVDFLSLHPSSPLPFCHRRSRDIQCSERKGSQERRNRRTFASKEKFSDFFIVLCKKSSVM